MRMENGRVQIERPRLLKSGGVRDLLGTAVTGPGRRIGVALMLGILLALAAAATWHSAAQADSGICDRTQEVQDAILDKLTTVSDCADVTDAHLSKVWGYLGLDDQELTALQPGDFAGLSGLNLLDLSINSIDTLPEGIFDGLASLHTLLLIYSGLDSLSEDVFKDLSSLQYLRLNGNDLTALPRDIFDGLNVIELNLQYNDLSTLPSDVFEGLDDLSVLGLDNNELDSLPDGLFEGLTSLNRLEIMKNPGSPFTFTAELVEKGNHILAVKVAPGTPYDMEVELSVENGSLSTETVTISGASTESSTIVVTPTGPYRDVTGAPLLVTVSVDSAEFLEGWGPPSISPELAERLLFVGIQAGTGESLILENSPATGAPTISGTAQVGQTLTAGTSGISDADGMTNPSFSYQWWSGLAAIDGATSSTYTPRPSDNGKVIRVRVTFTDDVGYIESLTSGATSKVVMGGL